MPVAFLISFLGELSLSILFRTFIEDVNRKYYVCLFQYIMYKLFYLQVMIFKMNLCIIINGCSLRHIAEATGNITII